MMAFVLWLMAILFIKLFTFWIFTNYSGKRCQPNLVKVK